MPGADSCANRREEGTLPIPAASRPRDVLPKTAGVLRHYPLDVRRSSVWLTSLQASGNRAASERFGGLMHDSGAGVKVGRVRQIPRHLFRTADGSLREELDSIAERTEGQAPPHADARTISSTHECAQESFLARPRHQRLLFVPATSNTNH